nr:metal-dependent hydrolase [Candidatus Sigynarchaeota archaeon]
MNGITHMVTGYFIARLFRRNPGKQRFAHDEFPVLFTAFAAILPDIDSSIGIPHAQATHTLVIAALLAVAYTAVVFLAGFPFLRKARYAFSQLLVLALLGVISHLALDIFTYYGADCSTALAHQYFWPLWNQSFHLDCLIAPMPPVYLLRALVEWAFYSPFLLVVLIYRGFKHKENPLAMFNPTAWLRRATGENYASQPGAIKIVLVLLGCTYIVIGVLEAVGVFLDVAGFLS